MSALQELKELPDYYKIPSISQSSLKVFLRSPTEYHAQYILGQTVKYDSPNMALGSLVHMLILEPQLLDFTYVFLDLADRPEPEKTMASKLNTSWKAAIEQQAREMGNAVVSIEVLREATAMVDVLNKHELATDLLMGWDRENLSSYTEIPIGWECELCEGLPLKSKLDRLLLDLSTKKALVVDYKTTSCANLRDFGYSVKRYGYDLQVAFYEDAARYFLAEKYPGVVWEISTLFIPQKSSYPYQLLGVIQLDEETLRQARSKYREGLQELHQCLKTNTWEAPSGIQVLQLSKPIEPLFSSDELFL